jgi:hypothetical protein
MRPESISNTIGIKYSQLLVDYLIYGAMTCAANPNLASRPSVSAAACFRVCELLDGGDLVLLNLGCYARNLLTCSVTLKRIRATYPRRSLYGEVFCIGDAIAISEICRRFFPQGVSTDSSVSQMAVLKSHRLS